MGVRKESRHFSREFKKTALVLIVSEYIGFIVSAHHDVEQDVRYVEAGLARHGILSQIAHYLSRELTLGTQRQISLMP
jgi:hypothetical protein